METVTRRATVCYVHVATGTTRLYSWRQSACRFCSTSIYYCNWYSALFTNKQRRTLGLFRTLCFSSGIMCTGRPTSNQTASAFVFTGVSLLDNSSIQKGFVPIVVSLLGNRLVHKAIAMGCHGGIWTSNLIISVQFISVKTCPFQSSV
jgi:hypothetical protein